MKKYAIAVIALSMIILTGCGLESKGDKAWNEAQKAKEESGRLMKQKEAYLRYKEAYTAAGAKATFKLVNKYLNSSIARIEFIFGETTSASDPAVKILRKDIETLIKQDGISDGNKNRYAQWLISVANNYRDNDDISHCIEELKNAKAFAADKTITDAVETETKSEYAKFQLESSKGFVEQAKKTKDPLDYIRAEYYAKATLQFDPKNSEAKKILSMTRKELIPSLNAYEAAITEYIDTTLFNDINSDGVLIAVPTVKSIKGKTYLDVSFYNNSYNAIKPKASMFKLVTTDGKEIQASEVEFEKKVLDQKFDIKGKLIFKGDFNKEKIKKLSFYSKSGDENAPAIVGDKYFQ
ncbi:MAG: hypothetical protein LBH98_02255 [Chitinispirillales bacterium]|jgi:hypothetical protein|nr:hypothetical protein [Chitinispirillales bacterium]